jgi:hypothetical protein
VPAAEAKTLQQNRCEGTFHAASVLGACSAKPIWASGPMSPQYRTDT